MGQSRIRKRIPFVIGGSISVSCLPKGANPGLRGGVGNRWRRAAVAGLIATDEAEESAETDRNMLIGACWLWVMVLVEMVLIFLGCCCCSFDGVLLLG